MDKTYEQARNIIIDSVAPLRPEVVSLTDAVGRVLAAEQRAPWGLPLWDNSAMDGFAIGREVCEDGDKRDRGLTVSGYIPAGKAAEGITLAPGCAVKIMTGAPVPQGTAAVVPVEQTEEADGVVFLKDTVKAGSNIRFRGEDVTEGEAIVQAGTRLRPAEVSLLASYGLLSVSVYRRPKVAILSTGDELVEPGVPAGPGQIVNSNSLALAAAVKEVGGEPIMLGIARDEPQELREKLAQGLRADALISSAGISIGDRDFVQEILLEMGVDPVFRKVRIKPGRPTTFGLHQGKPIFSLPGNPVSSLLTFELFVRPALLRMMGYGNVIKRLVKAELTEAIKKKPGNVQFYRVRLERQGDKYLAASAGDQNTGILTTLINANGIAILPAEAERFSVGDQIAVHVIGTH